jgi:hypothetical protein
MRDFCPVVLVLTGAMNNGREDVPMCSRITPKLVGDQLPGCLALMFQGPTKEPKLVGDQLPGCLALMFQGPTKEAFSGSTISTLGDQNIDHVSILIDGPP